MLATHTTRLNETRYATLQKDRVDLGQLPGFYYHIPPLARCVWKWRNKKEVLFRRRKAAQMSILISRWAEVVVNCLTSSFHLCVAFSLVFVRRRKEWGRERVTEWASVNVRNVRSNEWGNRERESESMTFFTDEYIMERKLISIGPVQILRLLCNATQ